MKRKIKDIAEHVELYRDPTTGIAWIENGKTGSGHSAHPNIDETGSPEGMINRGYWRRSDRLVMSHGFIYNTDRLAVEDDLDQIAADHCLCVACSERREAEQQTKRRRK